MDFRRKDRCITPHLHRTYLLDAPFTPLVSYSQLIHEVASHSQHGVERFYETNAIRLVVSPIAARIFEFGVIKSAAWSCACKHYSYTFFVRIQSDAEPGNRNIDRDGNYNPS